MPFIRTAILVIALLLPPVVHGEDAWLEEGGVLHHRISGLVFPRSAPGIRFEGQRTYQGIDNASVSYRLAVSGATMTVYLYPGDERSLADAMRENLEDVFRNHRMGSGEVSQHEVSIDSPVTGTPGKLLYAEFGIDHLHARSGLFLSRANGRYFKIRITWPRDKDRQHVLDAVGMLLSRIALPKHGAQLSALARIEELSPTDPVDAMTRRDVVAAIRALEDGPLGPLASPLRMALLRWLKDTPAIKVSFCGALVGGSDGATEADGILVVHAMLAQAAHLLDDRNRPGDARAAAHAAVAGMLRTHDAMSAEGHREPRPIVRDWLSARQRGDIDRLLRVRLSTCERERAGR